VLFALLAKFLLDKPASVQAVVLGLCTGLFVAAAAEADQRDPLIRSTVLLVISWGAAAAVLFYLGSVVQRRRAGSSDPRAPRWLYTVYGAVWIFGLVAALLAIFGDGGFRVAALAVVPLVLLAPTALHGIGQVARRGPG
jgi:hypothetical protein